MSEAAKKKHTPGWWKASRKSVFVSDSRNMLIAEIAPRSEREANARLIAAAPDMLAALNLAEELYQTGLLSAAPELIDGVVKARQAAIAKAEFQATDEGGSMHP